MNKLAFLKPSEIRGKTRLGKNSDGGYVVYGRLLKETDALLTYGVGWDISFEEHFNRETDKMVLMFDPTMFGKYLINFKFLKTSILNFRIGAVLNHLLANWLLWNKRRKLKAKQIIFVNEGIARTKSHKYDTLASHLERFNLKGKNLLLKMDIEAAEYDVFADNGIYKHLRQVNQLIIEVHDLKNRLHELQTIVTEIRKDFVIAHIHANNYGSTFRIYDFLNNGKNDIIIPDVLEISFVRKDKIHKDDLLNDAAVYPIADLDYPNNPYKKDYVIDFI